MTIVWRKQSFLAVFTWEPGSVLLTSSPWVLHSKAWAWFMITDLSIPCFHLMPETFAFQSVDPGQAASASPGSSLEMQTPRPIPELENQTLHVDKSVVCAWKSGKLFPKHMDSPQICAHDVLSRAAFPGSSSWNAEPYAGFINFEPPWKASFYVSSVKTSWIHSGWASPACLHPHHPLLITLVHVHWLMYNAHCIGSQHQLPLEPPGELWTPSLAWPVWDKVPWNHWGEDWTLECVKPPQVMLRLSWGRELRKVRVTWNSLSHSWQAWEGKRAVTVTVPGQQAEPDCQGVLGEPTYAKPHEITVPCSASGSASEPDCELQESTEPAVMILERPAPTIMLDVQEIL